MTSHIKIVRMKIDLGNLAVHIEGLEAISQKPFGEELDSS